MAYKILKTEDEDGMFYEMVDEEMMPDGVIDSWDDVESMEQDIASGLEHANAMYNALQRFKEANGI